MSNVSNLTPGSFFFDVEEERQHLHICSQHLHLNRQCLSSGETFSRCTVYDIGMSLLPCEIENTSVKTLSENKKEYFVE